MFVSVLLMFAVIGFGAANADGTDLDCGIIAPQGEQLKRSVATARAGEVPWHVATYTKKFTPYRQICAGTLVSATTVISVAHCYWDSANNVVQPPTQYAIAVGKLYKSWSNAADTHAQQSDVRDISIPVRFLGSVTNFQDDIAVLKLATTILFNTFVRPVCLNFDIDNEQNQLAPGKFGKIASWRFPASDSADQGQELQIQELPYVDIPKCFKEVPADFRELLTSDKFCAFKDSSSVLCRGGSGGGLAFPTEGSGRKRYYLRGVASTGLPREDNCSQFVAFTQVAKHEQFIKEHL